MSTREILTIQLGHYANHVGTHWWNIQETNFSYNPEDPSEINPDVLYREGEFHRKVTFTPRLLLVDLKGTLGYLSEEGNLSELAPENKNDETQILWEKDKLETIIEPKAPKSSFIQSLEQADNQIDDKNNDTLINLENETDKWVDYLLPRYHQRTINVVTEYEHQSTSQLFDLFPCGQNLWKTHKFSEDFVDRIRLYVEECHSIQGFQILLDADDGFSGLGASCIEFLRDEYGKSILALPVLDSAHRDLSVSDYKKVINTVLCWHHLGENSSLFSPLCCGVNGWLTPGKPRNFNNITYQSNLKYHSSALLATALDTISLRYRQKQYPTSVLSDLCADLNKLGRKAVATSLSLPFPIAENQDLIDVLNNFDGSNPWVSVTPSCNIETNHIMQSIALRGISENRLKRPLNEAEEQMKLEAYRCRSVHEMISLYLDCSCQSTATHLTSIEQALQIKSPYPRIFNSNILENGDISNRSNSTNVKSVPVMAGFHTGKFISEMYEMLHKHVKKIKNIRKFHAYLESGLEQDEFEESVNNLLDCKDNYQERDNI